MVELVGRRKVLQNIKQKCTKIRVLRQTSAVGADCAGACVCCACAGDMM